MAILGKCEVQVIVDGTPAEEYDDDEEEEVTANDKIATKYVEAVVGAHFAVKFLLQPSYSFTQGEDLVTARVEIDGHYAEGIVLDRKRVLNKRALGLTPSILIDGQLATENDVPREEQAIKKEKGGIKRERSGTVNDVFRPLKSSKGARGETIYHLDSDGEEEEEKTTRDEIEVVEDDGSETDEDIEIVQL
ncbi:hypothetical protein H2202_006121 [Exophiala xenobiotica]|nr:hypothetical protein H2202_006121 [Exophiala xenobiotica]